MATRQRRTATDATAIIITMITVGGTLILAIGGAAWRIGMRLGMVEQGLTGCEDKIRELRTDVREMGTEMQANVRELRTEVHTDIRELRTEIREVNRKVDRIIERLPPAPD